MFCFWFLESQLQDTSPSKLLKCQTAVGQQQYDLQRLLFGACGENFLSHACLGLLSYDRTIAVQGTCLESSQLIAVCILWAERPFRIPQTARHLRDHFLCLSWGDYGVKLETITVAVQPYLGQWFNGFPNYLSTAQTSSFLRYSLSTLLFWFYLCKSTTQWNSVSHWSTPDWNSFKGAPEVGDLRRGPSPTIF